MRSSDSVEGSKSESLEREHSRFGVAVRGRWPYYSTDEIEAVSSILASGKVNYWTGKEGRNFELEFARFMATKYAVAVSNGTVALELALMSVKVQAGDEVIVSPRTFIASASSIVNLGATPVFVDVDPETQNITAANIEKAISSRTKAVVCVHFAGVPCDMDPILRLSKRHKIKVVEDCAQAHGASYKGSKVGGLGDVAAWSFCQDKIMSTGGEGGMVTTNDKALWEKIWSYKDHGKCFDAVFSQSHRPGFRWVHHSIGTNFRMTEMQAVIGRLQLTKLNEWNRLRRENAEKLRSTLREFDFIRLPDYGISDNHAWYKFYAFFKENAKFPELTRDELLKLLAAEGIGCGQGSCSEVYAEQAFQSVDFKVSGDVTIAKQLFETSMLFPVHPTMAGPEFDQVCRVIQSVLRRV